MKSSAISGRTLFSSSFQAVERIGVPLVEFCAYEYKIISENLAYEKEVFLFLKKGVGERFTWCVIVRSCNVTRYYGL
jgi:hypothetical protein